MTERGFTLIELVMVITIAGVLVFLAMPRASTTALSVVPQAHQLAADIRLAQSLAMTRGARHCIVVAADRYSFARSSGGTCNVAAEHPSYGGGAVAFTGAALNPPTTIEFDGKGRPSAAATLTLSGGGESRTLIVTAETGRVVVQ